MTALVPTLLYDGDCGFCRRWIAKWTRLTAGKVDYAPYQEAISAYPQVTESQCEEAVQLIMPDGEVFSGARAVFKALALGGRFSRLLWLYEKLPLFGRLTEFFYRFVARHRTLYSKFSR